MRLNLLGVMIDALTANDLFHKVKEVVSKDDKIIIGNHNLHSVYLYHKDDKMKEFYNIADIIYFDGMLLIYWGRLLGMPLNSSFRFTCVDWIQPFMNLAAQNGWKVFHLGGKPGVADKAASILTNKIPELIIRTHHGYFDIKGTENKRVINAINSFAPNVLIVGMGMPRQEHWILENNEYLNFNVLISVGACFDYIAGEISTPPRWAGRLGLEWFFRLVSEPRRLWRRYLIEPWSIIPFAIRDLRLRFIEKR